MGCKKSIFKNLAPLALFGLIVCFLSWAPARQAQATVSTGCGNNEACPVCGDAIKGPGEECDDGGRCSNNNEVICDATDPNSCGEGNTCIQNDDDGCHNDCTLCPRCGNGVTQIVGRDGVQSTEPDEQCDDGNKIEGDDCNNDCTLPHCGDGLLNNDEECDDGNDSNLDLCNNNCKFTTCGDHIVQPNQGEQCDDGNDLPGDGCFECQTCPNFFCGDGVINTDTEECDDGNTDNGDGCSSDCKIEPPVCGNGIIEGDEACDGNDPNACGEGSHCIESGQDDECTCALNCGNGHVDDDEECDDGNQNNDDDCDNDCEFNKCPDGNGPPSCDQDHKTLICHVPPGNPENAHSICIDDSAVEHHLANHDGDSVGACENECNSDQSTVTITPPTASASGCSLILE